MAKRKTTNRAPKRTANPLTDISAAIKAANTRLDALDASIEQVNKDIEILINKRGDLYAERNEIGELLGRKSKRARKSSPGVNSNIEAQVVKILNRNKKPMTSGEIFAKLTIPPNKKENSFRVMLSNTLNGSPKFNKTGESKFDPWTLSK